MIEEIIGCENLELKKVVWFVVVEKKNKKERKLRSWIIKQFSPL